MQALSDLAPSAVLLVGDLCYADGYGSIWDTFGRAFETIGRWGQRDRQCVDLCYCCIVYYICII
jgi:hypothetical protein